MRLGQRLARRPVADEHKLRARLPLAQAKKRLHRHVEVFLRRDAPDVERHGIVRPRAPPRAQGLAAFRRIEERGIDAARHHAESAKTRRRQLRHHLPGGRQGQARAVVKPAEVGERGVPQRRHAVVPAIGVEVGVKARGHGPARPRRRRHRRQPQRPLGGDVHHVGPPGPPPRLQAPHHRQADAQRVVERDRHAGHQKILRARRLAALARPRHLHLMPASAQADDEAAERHRHAVDLGRIGLGDERELHAGGLYSKNGDNRARLTRCRAACGRRRRSSAASIAGPTRCARAPR